MRSFKTGQCTRDPGLSADRSAPCLQPAREANARNRPGVRTGETVLPGGLIARRTILLLLRRSVVGSISNRGRNYEPARLRSFCGQQNLKSHGQRAGIGGACRCMAAHVVRLPRLTLKAGRKAGYRAGSPRDGRADRGKTQKSKFGKFEISQIEKSQKSQS